MTVLSRAAGSTNSRGRSSTTIAMMTREVTSSKGAFWFKKLLGLDSRGQPNLFFSRALFWSCCCALYNTHGPRMLLVVTAFGGTTTTTTRTTTTRTTTTRTRPINSSPLLAGFAMHGSAFRGRRTIDSVAAASRRRLYHSSSSYSQEESFSMEALAGKLADSEFSNIVVLVGAGASCSAGIPDFRTPGKGLYDKLLLLGKHDLPFPEAIFDLGYYTKVTPMPFVDLCREIWPGRENGPKPTPTHRFLKLLEDKGFLHRVYTQNIDGLEALAGISKDKLVECHGHFRSASCTNCKTTMPIEECKKTMVENGKPPECSECGSLVKPDVVFFGEEMPSRFMELIDGDVAECDLLLVFGTSLLVMPVAGIPSWVAANVPRVLFNLEPAGGIGTTSSNNKKQDLFLQGDCDENVALLCDLAGWKGDLRKALATTTKD